MVPFGPATWQKLNRALGQPPHGRGDRCLLQCRWEWYNTGNSLNRITRHREPGVVTQPRVPTCGPLCLAKAEKAYADQEKRSACLLH